MFCSDRRVYWRADDDGGLAVSGIALAKNVILERQDAIVVRGTTPQHRAGGHHAADIGVYNWLVARATGLFRDAVV